MLKLRTNPTSAHADLSRAVARGTRAVFPHVILAIEDLRARKFPSVANVIQRIRQLTHDPRILALTHEWTAIIAAETGQDIENIRSEFQTAMALDPENQDITRNFQLFEDWLLSSAEPEPNHDSWELPATVPSRLDLHDIRAELSRPSTQDMQLAI
jgi:Tfp pilus assembly protein PilF